MYLTNREAIEEVASLVKMIESSDVQTVAKYLQDFAQQAYDCGVANGYAEAERGMSAEYETWPLPPTKFREARAA